MEESDKAKQINKQNPQNKSLDFSLIPQFANE